MQDFIPRTVDINEKIGEITVKQFDNNSRFLHVRFRDLDLTGIEENDAFDLADCTAAIYIEPEENDDPEQVNFAAGTIESAENGTLTFLLPGGVTQIPGRYTCEIWIYGGDEETQPVISSKPFTLVVEKSIRNDSAIEATPSMSALDAKMTELTSIRTRMDTLAAMADAGEIPAGTVEAEVADARAGKNVTYSSAGDAVRAGVQGLNTFLNAARWASETYGNDFDSLPNNILVPCGIDNSAGTVAHAPVPDGGVEGMIAAFGRSAARTKGDTQLYIPSRGQDVLFRQYLGDADGWSGWRSFSEFLTTRINNRIDTESTEINGRIDNETVREYPDRIGAAWFTGGKTVIDLPCNRIFEIGTGINYAAVGLPCDGIGTLVKLRPRLNSDTGTSFTVYNFTALYGSEGVTKQYYAFAIDNATAGSLVWRRYNFTPANRGIDKLGLESKSIVFLGDSVVDGLGSSDWDGYIGATGYGHSERAQGSDGFSYVYYTDATQTTEATAVCYFNTGSKSWVGRMIGYLTAAFSNVTAVNRGIGGLTAKELNRNLDNLVANGNGHFDVAVISVGANDRTKIADDPEGRILRPLASVIRKLISKGIQPVVLTNMPFWGQNGARPQKGKNPETLHSAILTACNREGVPCYDLFAEICGYMREHGLIWSDIINNDGLHPNDDGYEIMFRIAQKLLGVPSADD